MNTNPASKLPDSLLQFIALAVPTFEAAELLLFLAARRSREWQAEEVVSEIQPVAISVPKVKEYLALFHSHKILEENEQRYRYSPASAELEAGIAALAAAYNEHPVTLIQTIYKIAEARIKSFADSFKFKKD